MTADVTHSSEVQVESGQALKAPKSLESISVEPTLLDIETQQDEEDEEQVTNHVMDRSESQATQILHDEDGSQFDAASEGPHEGPSPTENGKTEKGPKMASANRLSISYARGNRRLVVNAEMVESLKLFRHAGRIEVSINVEAENEEGWKGILVSLVIPCFCPSHLSSD